MFGRNAKLPVDIMFGRKDEEQHQSYGEYVDKWTSSMKEAVEIAKEKAAKNAQQGKKSYDAKTKCSFINIGDRVLVRNLTPRGGTGKLRSYWEEKIHKVLDKKNDIPIYRVKAEDGSGKSRVLHRNMLKECNDLPVETTPSSENLKAKTKTKTPVNPVQQRQDVQQPGSESDDSDEERPLFYLEEVLTRRKSKRRNHPLIIPSSNEDTTEEVIEDEQTDNNDEGSPQELLRVIDIEDENESSIEAPQEDAPISPTNIAPPSIDDVLAEIPIEERSIIQDSSPEESICSPNSPLVPPRRSGRDRNPAKHFTYDVLGQPSMQPRRNKLSWQQETKNLNP